MIHALGLLNALCQAPGMRSALLYASEEFRKRLGGRATSAIAGSAVRSHTAVLIHTPALYRATHFKAGASGNSLILVRPSEIASAAGPMH